MLCLQLKMVIIMLEHARDYFPFLYPSSLPSFYPNPIPHFQKGYLFASYHLSLTLHFYLFIFYVSHMWETHAIFNFLCLTYLFVITLWSQVPFIFLKRTWLHSLQLKNIHFVCTPFLFIYLSFDGHQGYSTVAIASLQRTEDWGQETPIPHS